MPRGVDDSENIFYQARMRAAARDTDFESRTSTEGIVGISSTRLYQIERGIRQPHRDELIIMAKEYGAPELLKERLDAIKTADLSRRSRNLSEALRQACRKSIEAHRGEYHTFVRDGVKSVLLEHPQTSPDEVVEYGQGYP